METEEERRARRRMRIEEMKREKRRTQLLYKGIGALAAAVIFGGGIWGIRGISHLRQNAVQERQSGSGTEENGIEENGGVMGGEGQPSPADGYRRKSTDRLSAGVLPEGGQGLPAAVEPVSGGGLAGFGPEAEGEPVPAVQVFSAHSTADTKEFDESIISRYGIVIDAADGVILAQKEAQERMNPASMTKILTVLVAAEHISQEELDETAEITIDITDYCYINDCSITGYDLGEKVPVRDLFYGTVLPSGADSALALAIHVAGSHEAFVDLMNEKLEELGLAETTHFTNCVGLYNEDHYSTAYDMAMILKAAVDNEFCRDVLSAHIYTTSVTEQHPEGLRISNWFLRRIEDRETHGEVLCGKTGFVNESGSCAASYCLGSDGGEYLCVTAGSTSAWNCIDDQAALYRSIISE